MTKKRLLIAHPYLTGKGGENAVAAWAVEALRADYDLTLGLLAPVDPAAVNEAFGTSLELDDFRMRVTPASWRAMLRAVPTRGALMDACVMMRWAADLDRRERFDGILCTQNEADFHRRGIQYVHYPRLYMPRPDHELRWFHHLPGLLALYRTTCARVGRCTQEGMRRNLTLANSEFVAGRIRDSHGIGSIVLPPPVTGEVRSTPWESRRLAVVCVGRIYEAKRWHWAVEAVEAVRARGHALELTIVGHRDSPAYLARLEGLASTRMWMRLKLDLAREQLLDEIAAHRYGMHPMEEEHFGIAPAELQRSGCLTFVHRSGGPMEIVGHHPGLMFDSPAEAARLLIHAIEDRAHEANLRAHVESRRDLYSAERFCASLREIVAGALRE